MGSRHLVIIGMVGVGALTAGGAAAAIGDGGAGDPVVEEPTTTVADGTTTTVEESTTSMVTTTAASTTTVVETTTTVPTTTSPDPVEGADGERGPDPHGPAKHGLCRAFSGRSGQPGNSQAYANLFEAAGGDIEAFCADVLSSPEAEDDAEPPSEDDEASAGRGHQRPDHPGRGHGNSNGKGKSKAGKGAR